MSLSREVRGQSAIELLILVTAVVFFVALFLLGVRVNIDDRVREQTDIVLLDVASTVRDEIALAAGSTDGYFREFELPLTILGKEYEINITGSFVYARTVDGQHALSLPVASATGDVVIGTNVIQNVGGEVILNP